MGKKMAMETESRLKVYSADTRPSRVATITPGIAVLADCERKIGEALKATRDNFVVIGRELKRVRDESLYRETHSSFAAYAEDRWAIGRTRLYQFIDATERIDILKLSTTVDSLPVRESQLRELSRCETPEQTALAWRRATDSVSDAEQVTAKQIREIVGSIIDTNAKQSSQSTTPVSGPAKSVSEGRPAIHLADTSSGLTDLAVAAIEAMGRCRELAKQSSGSDMVEAVGHLEQAFRKFAGQAFSTAPARSEPTTGPTTGPTAKTTQPKIGDVRQKFASESVGNRAEIIKGILGSLNEVERSRLLAWARVRPEVNVGEITPAEETAISKRVVAMDDKRRASMVRSVLKSATPAVEKAVRNWANKYLSGKRGIFIAPTEQDIEQYAREVTKDKDLLGRNDGKNRNAYMQAPRYTEDFYAFYVANGWVQGHNGKPLTEWRLTFLRWCRENWAKDKRDGVTPPEPIRRGNRSLTDLPLEPVRPRRISQPQSQPGTENENA